MQVSCNLPKWCDGCPHFDPHVSCIFGDSSLEGMKVFCQYQEVCARVAQRALDDWPRFIRVKDCPPPPGRLVLCAMSKDGLWYPRWGKYVDGRWEIKVRPGAVVNLADFELDWWMPLSPPEAPMGEGGSS